MEGKAENASKSKLESIQQKTSFKFCGMHQRCQMVYFQTKNPNLGKFWWA
jgi:hypothetical protein